MSPFADALRTVRFRHGLRQIDLAERMGCSRNYLSALENDQKTAPGAPFVEQLIRVLGLPEDEASQLRRARDRSQRSYVVPPDAPKLAYELVYELFARLERVSELQVQGMLTILALGPGQDARPAGVEGRLRRVDRQQNHREDTM